MQELPMVREERDAIGQMVRSPGWALFLKHVLIPRLQQATNQLDAPHGQEAHYQYWRGIKADVRHVLTIAYQCAQLPNPLEEHFQAFLATLNIPSNFNGTEEPLQEELVGSGYRPQRPAYPVV